MKLHISLSAAAEISFADAQKGSMKLKRQYLLQLWQKLNREKFDGHLPKPVDILVQSRANVSKISSDTTKGYWLPLDRIISLCSEFIKESPEFDVENTLLHEMCHQAVTDIDKKVEKNPHGPRWVKWTKRVNLNEAHINSGKWSDDLAKGSTKTYDVYPANQIYEGDRIQTFLMNDGGSLLVKARTFKDGKVTLSGTASGLKDMFGNVCAPAEISLVFSLNQEIKVLKSK